MENPPKRNLFINFATDCSLSILQFLDAQSLLNFSASSRGLLKLARHSHCWKSHLREELGIDDASARPPGFSAVEDEHDSSEKEHTHFNTYLIWRRSFSRYPNVEIKRVRSWWLRMESFLAAEFSELHATLGPPLDDADLDSAETEKGGGVIPITLRLLYRFHDGQHLTGQMRMLQQEAPRERRFHKQEEMRELGLGLLGGHSSLCQATRCQRRALETRPRPRPGATSPLRVPSPPATGLFTPHRVPPHPPPCIHLASHPPASSHSNT